MPTVLSLSSQVVRGHVGNSVAQFVLQRMGLEVLALPTVIFSSAPHIPRWAGTRIAPETIGDMLDALEANGWLAGIDALFTGYLPSADHVALAAGWTRRLKAGRPSLTVVCDPILGDAPHGLYVEVQAARALRETLVPLADIVTPNRFELGWLTGTDPADPAATLAAARQLLDRRGLVLATSAPAAEAGGIANVLVSSDRAWRSTVARRDGAPHGTGDLMAALFVGHVLGGRSPEEALALATAGVEIAIEASAGADRLRLIASQDGWATPRPWPVARLEADG